MGFAIAAAFIHCLQNIPSSEKFSWFGEASNFERHKNIDMQGPQDPDPTSRQKNRWTTRRWFLDSCKRSVSKFEEPIHTPFSNIPHLQLKPWKHMFKYPHCGPPHVPWFSNFQLKHPCIGLTVATRHRPFWEKEPHEPCRPLNAPTVRRPKPPAGKLKLPPKECASRPGRSVNSMGTLAPAFGHFSFQRPSTTSMASWSCIRDDWWFQGRAFGQTFGTCRMGFQSVHAGVRPSCLWPGFAARRWERSCCLATWRRGWCWRAAGSWSTPWTACCASSWATLGCSSVATMGSWSLTMSLRTWELSWQRRWSLAMSWHCGCTWTLAFSGNAMWMILKLRFIRW